MTEVKEVKIAVIYAGMDALVGESQSIYGVPCKHEVVNAGKANELHLAVATVDAGLADEMIKIKRARLYADAIK